MCKPAAAPRRALCVLVLVFALSCDKVRCSYSNPHFVGGRTTIVQLFEWTWPDVAQECEEFLGPRGYGGVQVSPPSENAVQLYTTPGGDLARTWYERYEPISYTLSSPSGEADEFATMVKRCTDAGVRVYVDAVLNHMTSDIGQGEGYAGSRFDSHTYTYEGVPYGAMEFHSLGQCGSTNGRIEDYNNAVQVRNCKYLGRADLDHAHESVQQKVVGYLNQLLSLGVAGYRIDSASYMWPRDLQEIYSKLSNLNETFGFEPNSRPFIYHEISPRVANSSDEYKEHGAVTEPLFYKRIVNAVRRANQAQLKDLKSYITSGVVSADFNSSSVLYVDSHEIQRGVDVENFDDDVITYKDRRAYVSANVLMLAQPEGIPRVMSSYQLDRKTQPFVPPKLLGPPSDHAFNTLPVLKKANYICYNGWICEHRWAEIRRMVQFRNAVHGAPVAAWWDDDADAIAFARQGKGFVVVNNGRSTVSKLLETMLPPGYYCDVISGAVEDRDRCTGLTIKVRRDSFAYFRVESDKEVPVVALHINARVFPDL